MSSPLAEKTYVNGGSIVVLGAVFPVLGAIAIAFRAWARRLRKTEFGADGWLCVAAWALLCGCSAVLIIGAATHTIGYHSQPGSAEYEVKGFTTLRKLQFAYNQMWYPAIGSVKLSFLFFYRRIFRGRPFAVISALLIWLAIIWSIVFSVLNIFVCGKHVDDNWMNISQRYKSQCLDLVSIYLAAALSDCFIDIAIFLVPLPAVWSLQIPTKQKAAIISIFALGAFCIAAAAVRLTLYVQVWWAIRTSNHEATFMGLRGADDYGVTSRCIFWSHIELGIAIIASCLPSLKPVLSSATIERLRSSVYRKSCIGRMRPKLFQNGSLSIEVHEKENEALHSGSRKRTGELYWADGARYQVSADKDPHRYEDDIAEGVEVRPMISTTIS